MLACCHKQFSETGHIYCFGYLLHMLSYLWQCSVVMSVNSEWITLPPCFSILSLQKYKWVESVGSKHYTFVTLTDQWIESKFGFIINYCSLHMNIISIRQLNTNYSALFLSDKNVRLPSSHLADLLVKAIQRTLHHHHHPIHTFHEDHMGKPGQAIAFLRERAL